MPLRRLPHPRGGGENPTSADAKYGITCVGCHTPHENTTEGGAWDEEWTPQLRTGSAKTLCVECHNGEIPEGTTAAPGTEIHHPMKEMMEGYGAIDVSSFPSVHKGKCVAVPHAADERQPRQRAAGWQPHVQHHRAGGGPRGLSDPGGHDERRRDGVPERYHHHHQHGDLGQHAVLGVQHLPQQQQRCPATPRPVVTTTATPNPTASPLRVTVTINQTANQTAWGNNQWWRQGPLAAGHHRTASGVDQGQGRRDLGGPRRWPPSTSATPTPAGTATRELSWPSRQHVDHGRARVPQQLHERRVRGQRGQLRPPQLGLLEGDRQHGHDAGEDRPDGRHRQDCRGS